MKKYGVANFVYEVITVCLTQDDANYVETQLIKQYDSCNKEKGYNVEEGGNNSPMSEETKEKMRAVAAARSEDYYDYMKGNIINAGRVQPPEWKAMIQACNNTEEARAKKSATLKEAYANGTRVSAQKGKPAHNKGKKGPPAPNKINWTDEQIEAIKNDTRSSYKVAADYNVSSFVIQKLRKQLGIKVLPGNTRVNNDI